MSLRFNYISSVAFLLFVVSYIFLLFGISIFLSDWITDRMLHNQFNYFQNLSLTHAPQLYESVSYLQSLADQTSVFNIFGIIFSLTGVVGIIISLFFSQTDGVEIDVDDNDWKKLPPSNNTLSIIFSTLFAVSLIFITVADQAKSNTEQTLFATMLMTNGTQTVTSTTNSIINEIIAKNALDYFINVRHALFTAQLGVSFLIMTVIRYKKTQFTYVLNSYLLSACALAFCTWAVTSVLDIGITGPPTQPNIDLPKLDSR